MTETEAKPDLANEQTTTDAGAAHRAAERRALARYYDLDLQDDPDDLDLYLALAKRTDGPILELAVGTGRIAIPLARAGYAVTGVDLDPAMLERAQWAWDRSGRERPDSGSGRERPDSGSGSGRPGYGSLRLMEDDITSVRLGEQFALVILALNSLTLLDDPERQLAALRTIAGHLRPDGRAVIDVWLPGPDDLALYDGRLLLEWVRDDPETGDRVTKSASARYDSATQRLILTQLFDAASPHDGTLRRTLREDHIRLVGAAEVTAMLGVAGLQVEDLAGDHRMAPFGPGAERAVIVVRAV